MKAPGIEQRNSRLVRSNGRDNAVGIEADRIDSGRDEELGHLGIVGGGLPADAYVPVIPVRFDDGLPQHLHDSGIAVVEFRCDQLRISVHP